MFDSCLQTISIHAYFYAPQVAFLNQGYALHTLGRNVQFVKMIPHRFDRCGHNRRRFLKKWSVLDDLWREENTTSILNCHFYRPDFDNTEICPSSLHINSNSALFPFQRDPAVQPSNSNQRPSSQRSPFTWCSLLSAQWSFNLSVQIGNHRSGISGYRGSRLLYSTDGSMKVLSPQNNQLDHFWKNWWKWLKPS